MRCYNIWLLVFITFIVDMTSGLAGKRVGASVGHRDIKHAFDLSSSNTSLSGTSSLAWNETGSGVTSSGNARSTPLLAAARDADEAAKTRRSMSTYISVTGAIGAVCMVGAVVINVVSKRLRRNPDDAVTPYNRMRNEGPEHNRVAEMVWKGQERQVNIGKASLAMVKIDT